MEGNLNLDFLSEEILFDILPYVKFHERKSTLCHVSKTWKRICKDAILNVSTTVRSDLTSAQCIELFNSSPYMKYLKIIHRTDLDVIVPVIGKSRHTQLTVIKILKSAGSGESTKINSKSILHLLERSKLVENFKMDNCRYRSKKFFTILRSLNNLRKISLVGETFAYNAIDILPLIRACKNLTSIKLFSYNLNLTDVDIIIISSEMGPRLTRLKISAEKLTDVSLDYLITNNKELKVVHFKSAFKFTGEGTLKLSQLPNIVSFGFINVNNNWESLTFSPDWAARLRKINLSGFGAVNDVVLNEISNQCLKIEKLNLSGCKNLSPDGFGLDQILQNCSLLYHLNIFWTPINISQVIGRNSNVISAKTHRLKEIVYSRNEYNETSLQEFNTGLEYFKKNKPTLRFVDSVYHL